MTSQWLCLCGKKANTIRLFWVWRVLPRGSPRWVCYECVLECEECSRREQERNRTYHRRDDAQYLSVGLTASSKEALARQVLAQVVGRTRGYLPKSDLRKAISQLAMAKKSE